MNSEDIRKALAKSGKHLLAFSRGKDAIAAALALLEANVNFIPVYFAPAGMVLGFEEVGLKYYEGILDRHIVRLPHTKFYDQLFSGLFQPEHNWDILNAVEFEGLETSEVYDQLRAEFKCPNAFQLTGVRSADSVQRRIHFSKSGAYFPETKKAYPIFDWNAEQCEAIIRKHNVKLPIDYQLWGRSFDGLNYKYFPEIKKNFPQDWAKILELLPLAELEIARYENYLKHITPSTK